MLREDRRRRDHTIVQNSRRTRPRRTRTRCRSRDLGQRSRRTRTRCRSPGHRQCHRRRGRGARRRRPRRGPAHRYRRGPAQHPENIHVKRRSPQHLQTVRDVGLGIHAGPGKTDFVRRIMVPIVFVGGTGFVGLQIEASATSQSQLPRVELVDRLRLGGFYLHLLSRTLEYRFLESSSRQLDTCRGVQQEQLSRGDTTQDINPRLHRSSSTPNRPLCGGVHPISNSCAHNTVLPSQTTSVPRRPASTLPTTMTPPGLAANTPS